MNGQQPTNSERRVSIRTISTLVIGGISGLTFAIHLLHLLEELDEVLALLIGVIPPMVISVALLGGSYWLWQSSIEDEYHLFVIAWVVGGSVVIGGVGVSVIVYQSAHGTPQTDVVHVIANWVVTGAFGGFLTGVYDARRRSLTDALRRERDALTARERSLNREVERLDRFASIVSHDLRNPLNVAKGRLELARETGEAEHLEAAASALSRMETIISDSLTLAREGGSVAQEDWEAVSLSDCVETCWESAPTADANLEIDGEMTLNADQSRLRTVFENLFRNAVEHGGEDVTVRVGPLDEGNGFYVEDDGVGLSPDGMETVLEPGYSTSDEGTGLGLLIVREIIAGHDWNIDVVEGSDGGARFEITGVERP